MALVRLPTSTKPSPPAGDRDEGMQRILYVEDEDDNFIVAQFALRDRFELVQARTDREACEILRDEQFEIILMDIQLSGSVLNGIELTQALKGIPRENCPDYALGINLNGASVIIVTAYAARYSEQDMVVAGGDGFVTKPVDFVRLNLSMSRMIKSEETDDLGAIHEPAQRLYVPEKRQDTRVKIRLDCYLRIEGQEHAAQISDVSSAGARIRISGNIPVEKLSPGTLCQITFATAWGFVESRARVMWVREQKLVELGIGFEDMGDEVQKILLRELADRTGAEP
jgi:CheY-like chemotaxis protein